MARWNLRMRLCNQLCECMIVPRHFAFIVQFLRNSEVSSRFDPFFMIIDFLCREVYKRMNLIPVKTSTDTFSRNVSECWIVEVKIGAKRRKYVFQRLPKTVL